jgi:SPP1 gp7 family putative phage head morphogenesis protein
MSVIQQHYYRVLRRLKGTYIDSVRRIVSGRPDNHKLWGDFQGSLLVALQWADLAAAAKLRYKALHQKTIAPHPSIAMVMELNPWYAEHAEQTMHDISIKAMLVAKNERDYYQKIAKNKRKTINERVPEYRIERLYRDNLGEIHQVSQQTQLAIPEIGNSFPFCEYSTREDARVRPTHAAMDRFVAVRTHEIWRIIRPKNGYNCRCGVIYITRLQAKEKGWIKKNGEYKFDIKWPNSASKKNYEDRLFPDPGWFGPKYVAP